ncbi:Fc.00g045770.m01.CDS01 [Cosmosporella sp. VM-42]
MPSAAQKAKAKLEAVLNDPGRNDSTNRPNRMAATRYPSSGSEYTNTVARRPSQSSQGSDGSGIKNFVKRALNLPAY